MQPRLMAVMIAATLSGAWIPAMAQPHYTAYTPMFQQTDVGLARASLKDAESSMHHAVQDMNFKADAMQADQAIGAAYEAQNSTQRALALLPRDARHASAASYQHSLDRLQEAADDDRKTIQQLADLPVSKSRDEALDQARHALADTQDAMLDIAPHLS